MKRGETSDSDPGFWTRAFWRTTYGECALAEVLRVLEHQSPTRLAPRQIKVLSSRRAIPQVQVDQALVRNADLLRFCLEVVNGILVQPNRDLPRQLRRVGVLPGVGEIVFFSHGAPSVLPRLDGRGLPG